MPIQVDNSRPIRTVDASGKVISTNTNDAAPIKTIDTAGRSIQQELKAETKQVAEEAAKNLPNFAAGQTSVASNLAPPEDKPQGQETPETKDAEKVTEAKIRKEYLEAQRIKRQAQEMEKKAKSNLEKAEAFDKARALAENGEDPTALLRAAGLDPIKFYRDMTNYALSDKAKDIKPVDPVQKELQEHKERLDKYAKDLEEKEKATREKEELMAHNQVISDRVIPMLKNNPDKYETLLAQYGADAAVEVYKNVWEIYQQTGQARSFEQVADEMEKYWSEQVESGIIKALQLKKFKEKYAHTNPELNRNTIPERQETPTSSVTLSNKQQITTPPVSKLNPYKGMTKEERVQAILTKFDK